jgi:phage shock protein PspC (stress-responsive transcriptional regulator)
MHKVISINLNGNAYQLDEAGYDALRAYLADAEHQLRDNPDRAEIVADLEQAIADKCHAYLDAHKTVVSTDEIQRIIAEMGPVEGPGDAPGTKTEQAKTTEETREAPSRRLYRVPAGSMIAGVCTGLAAYFQVDVALVRVAFVIAGLLTKGVAIVAYVVMMFAIPEASTPEEAAGGAPLNAKDVINRARVRTAATGREWRRHWRQQRRDWRRHRPAAPVIYVPSPFAAAGPVFALVHIALFLVMAAMLISLVNTGMIFDRELPSDVPVWAAALVLLIGYQVVVSPFRAARLWGQSPGPFAFWTAVGWLIGLAFAVWIASNHIPEIAEFIRRVPDLFRDFLDAMRDLSDR